MFSKSWCLDVELHPREVNLPRAFVRFDNRLTTEIVLRMSGEITTDFDEQVA